LEVGVTVTTIFECAWALRGYERLLSDFVLNPERAEQILGDALPLPPNGCQETGRMGVDMIWTGDDVGAQTSDADLPPTLAALSEAHAWQISSPN